MVQLNFYMQQWLRCTEPVVGDCEPHAGEGGCSGLGASSPCIANGDMVVTVNGEKQTHPGTFELGGDFKLAVANLPKECKYDGQSQADLM